MSKVLTYTHVDTTGGASQTLATDAVNWGTDFTVTTQKSSEGQVTNMTMPLDRKETFRWQSTGVPDIYAGSDIVRSLRTNSTRGVKVFLDHKDTWKLTDSDDATFEAHLPVSCQIMVKVPANEQVTASVVKALVIRTLSGLFETDDDGTDRLNALLRGSVLPTDL